MYTRRFSSTLPATTFLTACGKNSLASCPSEMSAIRCFMPSSFSRSRLLFSSFLISSPSVDGEESRYCTSDSMPGAPSSPTAARRPPRRRGWRVLAAPALPPSACPPAERPQTAGARVLEQTAWPEPAAVAAAAAVSGALGCGPERLNV